MLGGDDEELVTPVKTNTAGAGAGGTSAGGAATNSQEPYQTEFVATQDLDNMQVTPLGLKHKYELKDPDVDEDKEVEKGYMHGETLCGRTFNIVESYSHQDALRIFVCCIFVCFYLQLLNLQERQTLHKMSCSTAPA